MTKSKLFPIAILTCFIVLAGCAKSADTSKPLDQIKSEVQTMSLNDLQGHARAYAQRIEGKKNELSKVAERIKTLTPDEVFGSKSKEIKDQLAQIEIQVNALSERYQIYAEKFKEKGGDLSSIRIG